MCYPGQKVDPEEAMGSGSGSSAQAPRDGRYVHFLLFLYFSLILFALLGS